MFVLCSLVCLIAIGADIVAVVVVVVVIEDK